MSECSRWLNGESDKAEQGRITAETKFGDNSCVLNLPVIKLSQGTDGNSEHCFVESSSCTQKCLSNGESRAWGWERTALLSPPSSSIGYPPSLVHRCDCGGVFFQPLSYLNVTAFSSILYFNFIVFFPSVYLF